MNQRAMVQLEVEKNGKIFTFLMPIGAPFGECYDAAFECATEILKMAQDAAKKADLMAKGAAIAAGDKPVIEMTAEEFQNAINKAN